MGDFPNKETQFSSTNQPEKNGRPRKMISTINAELKAEGYEVATNSHILDAYQTLINLPIAKVAAIANKDIAYKQADGTIVYLEEGDKYPMLYRLIAKELIGKRGGDYLEKMLDRAYGKAKQTNEFEFSKELTIKVIRDALPG